MKLTKLSLSLLALSFLTAPVFAYDVPAGCAVPSIGSPTRTLYVDPTKGADANSGTQANPWKSIQGAKIKGGDAVLLAGGKYGDVRIDGLKLSAFALISAAPGAVPLLTTLAITNSSHWVVQGLKIQSQATPATAYTSLVNVTGDNIIVDSNKLSSIDSAAAWTPADWVAKGRFFALSVDGGDANSTKAKCVSFTNNAITNVRYGMSLSANDLLAQGNTIDNFGDDAVDFAGSRIVIRGNNISNSHDIGDGNHNDAMQGQTGRGVNGTVYDSVTIDGNTVIAKATPGLPFPGDLQGIDAFDMDWSNLTVINNVVVTNAYHGISFYSVHKGLIANNTVLGTLASVGTWIGVSAQSHQGTPSNDVTVQNNIASNFSFDTPAAVADHNLVVGQIAWQTARGPQWISTPGTYGDHNTVDPKALSLFQAFDIAQANYDLHLVAGSPAGIGAFPIVADPTPIPATPTGFTLLCQRTSVAGAYNCKQTVTP